MAQDTVFSLKSGGIFDLNSGPVVMGILNVTPDSFSDGGKFTSEAEWLRHAERMVNEGAAIIDIGGVSTRPGAPTVSSDEELRRLLPAVTSVRKRFPGVILSVDTFRSEVARAAVDAGADMINDISGGSMDERMFETIADLDVIYVLMHIQGTPQTMQLDPVYDNVVDEVKHWISERLDRLRSLGVGNVIIDPGFGFGKTIEHNFLLLKELEKFGDLGAPVLVGLSRKSMINKLLNISNKDSVIGTSVLNHIALQNGACILRVHDVKEAMQVIELHKYLSSI
jgi:dihydropteroate synthase